MVYRGWDPEVFLEPVPEGSAGFPYVFFQTVDMWEFKILYDFTLLKFAIPVLGSHEKGFYGVGPFEMYLDAQAVVCPLEPFPQSMDVRYHYGDVFIAVVV